MRMFRLYWDREKEERWFNEMAAKGWALSDFFLGVYHFEKCEPGEYIYQIDLMEEKRRDRNEFKEFLLENKVEILDECGRWIFLRKKASEGPFDLYTDAASRKKQYKKIRNIFGLLFLLELICLTMEVDSASQMGDGTYWLFTLLLGAITLGFGVMMAKYHLKVKER